MPIGLGIGFIMFLFTFLCNCCKRVFSCFLLFFFVLFFCTWFGQIGIIFE